MLTKEICQRNSKHKSITKDDTQDQKYHTNHTLGFVILMRKIHITAHIKKILHFNGNITAHLKKGGVAYMGINIFLFLQLYTRQDLAKVAIGGEAVVIVAIIIFMLEFQMPDPSLMSLLLLVVVALLLLYLLVLLLLLLLLLLLYLLVKLLLLLFWLILYLLAVLLLLLWLLLLLL